MKLKYKLLELKENIKRVIAYIPIIWKMKDWDWAYNLDLLAFSLKRLYKVQVEGYGVFPKKKRRRMKTAIKCLERMSNTWENYIEPHYEYIENNYGELPNIFDRKKYNSSIQKKLYWELVVTREGKMFNRDMELFCKILKKDLRNWWS